MRLFRSLIVAALCAGFTPGLGELIGDGLHLLSDGHTHHADGHDDPGPEHGCNGWQHTCACHVSMSVASAALVSTVPAATVGAQQEALDATERGPSGVRDQVDRPPRA